MEKREFELNNIEHELTAAELAEACREVLDPETCAEIEGMEPDEAMGYAFTCLIEVGIDDPEEFLIEKGLLEQRGE